MKKKIKETILDLLPFLLIGILTFNLLVFAPDIKNTRADIINFIEISLDYPSEVREGSVFDITAHFKYSEVYYCLYGNYIWLLYSTTGVVTSSSNSISTSINSMGSRPSSLVIPVNTTTLGLVAEDIFYFRVKITSGLELGSTIMKSVDYLSDTGELTITKAKLFDASLNFLSFVIPIILLASLSSIKKNKKQRKVN